VSPTVLKQGGWQIVIHTDDHTPAHVHVRRAGGEVARVQLDPVELMDSWQLNKREIGVIVAIVKENQALLLEEWDKYHTSR
jgi:hypothetical protein